MMSYFCVWLENRVFMINNNSSSIKSNNNNIINNNYYSLKSDNNNNSNNISSNSNNSRTDISVSHFCSAFKAFQQQQQQQNGSGNKKALFEFNMKGNWIFLHLRNSCSPQKHTKGPFFAKWHFSQKKELCNLTKASNRVKYYPKRDDLHFLNSYFPLVHELIGSNYCRNDPLRPFWQKIFIKSYNVCLFKAKGKP